MGRKQAALINQLRSLRGPAILQELERSQAQGVRVNTRVCATVISGLARSGMPSEAVAFLRGLPALGVEPDLFAYTAAIKACARGGLAQQAMALFTEMRERGLQPDEVAFTSVMDAFATGGDLEQVRALARQASDDGLPPNAVVYNTLLKACANSQRWEEALALLAEMRGIGLLPNVTSYNSAINACAKAGQTAPTLALLAEMRGEGPPPDVVTYNTVINHLVSVALVDDADALFLEGLAAGVFELWSAAGDGSVTFKSLPRATALAVLRLVLRDMAAAPEDRRSPRAHDASRDLRIVVGSSQSRNRTGGVRPAVLAMLREVGIKCRLARGASPDVVVVPAATLQKYVADARAAGMPALPGADSLAASPPAEGDAGMTQRQAALIRRLKTLDGVEVLAELALAQAGGVAVDKRVASAAVNCLTRGRLPREALRFFRSLPRQAATHDGVLYAAAIDACAKAGDPEQAAALLEEMRDAGIEPNIVAVNSAIDACAQAGLPEAAEALLADVRERGALRPNVRTYGAVINAHAQVGQLEEARALMRTMRDEGMRPTAVTYSTLIKACADGEQAEAILAEMREEGLQPNSRCYHAALDACANAGELERALELRRRMLGEGVQEIALTYNTLIKAHTHRGDWGAALALLAECRAKGLAPDVITYAAVIACLQAAGRASDADALFLEALRIGLWNPWVTRAVDQGDLNLLGFPRAAALAALRLVLRDMVPATPGARALLPSADGLRIITGHGRARAGLGGSVLQPAVIAALAGLGIECSVDPSNAGRLLVTAESLQQYVAGVRASPAQPEVSQAWRALAGGDGSEG